MALLPIDDATRSLNDSILPSVMIWDGGDAYEQLVMRNALPATDPRSLDLDACAIAVGIYRVMTAAAEKALPPAPCDEPPEDGDGLPAPGQSPAGAVDEASSEVEAPASQDLKALQAENERLKDEIGRVNNEFGSATPDWPEAWKRVADLKQLAGDRWRENVELKEQIHVLTTALAESERKRVEALTALSLAKMERDDARTGEANWAARCGVTLNGSSRVVDILTTPAPSQQRGERS